MTTTHPERLSAAISVRTFQERRQPRHARTTTTREATTPLYARHLREFLATRLGRSEAGIYRMLDQGLIPGVQKVDPGKPKSHWFAPDPEACVRRFFARERGNGRAA